MTELQRKICLRVLMYLVEIFISHQSKTSTELSPPIPIPYTTYQYGVRRRSASRRAVATLKTNVKGGGGGIIILKIKGMIAITINIYPHAFLSTEFISVMLQIKTDVYYKSYKNVKLLFNKTK